MAEKKSNLWVRMMLLLGVILGLLIYYVSGPGIQAKQILIDVQRYQKSHEMTPTVAQLRKQSATFRNLKGKCPCYSQLSVDHFKLKYRGAFWQTYEFHSVHGKWAQSSPK
ncbi:hypothetical protein [Marinicellulosiphila megalodicopiae]|uniref:hypothetical protein n=1 Tax=Marinicellulosiphila megalodicopiae TaxID=2724896 RepID=UPI003BAF89F6